MTKKEKFFEGVGYIIIIGLIVGQCTVGSDFYIGQGLFLFANLCAVVRSFCLHRPMADKIKDCSCTAITCGLICIKILGGIVS